MFLKKIPNEVQCLLNASARINNFKQAIEELVYNSLDAESSSIAIRVHIQKNWVQVVDNGLGIRNVDFNLLGERHATSKLLDVYSLKSAPSKYGYRGQALANIINVSQTVKITSRHINSDETWGKIFCVGKEPECFKTVKRPSKGTTVEIIGFLFNHNIQRKSINPLNEVQEVRLFLEQLSVLFSNISISLRDDSERKIVFKMHKNRDIYQTLKSLFDITTVDVKELQVEKSEYKVRAYIGNSENDGKKFQWIYLNSKFINNNSNLHKLLNMKFSKTKSLCDMQTKKIKSKAIYNEENQVESRSDELYFLFISCPYSDYDIIYSGKQTTIEFQDWEQINKLIDKLVQFYKGDNLLSVQRNDTDKNIVTENKLDTRIEVKKIMEKVLGTHNKKSKISEVQKGIKGRLLKRKKKKEPLKNASKYPIHPQTSLNFADNKPLRSEVFTKSPLKTCDTKVQLKSRTDKNKFKYKTKKKSSEHLNRLLKYKCNDNYDKLLDIFKNYPNTTKRRCNELSNHIRKVFNIYSCSNTGHKSFDQFVNIIRGTENIEEKSRVIRKVEKTFQDLQLPKQPDIKCVRNNKNSKIGKITSHSLLQTILKTQDCHRDKELIRTDTHFNIQRSNIYQTTRTLNGTFKPTLTFQSHKYSIQETLQHKSRTKKQKFISRQSRQNFIFDGDNNSELILPVKKNSYDKCLFKTKKHKSNFHNRFFYKYKQSSLDTTFSIDLSESDIIEFSKKIRNQIITDMNFLSNTNKYNKPQCNEKLNFEINFNIESTYTILQDSFQGNPQMLTNNDSCIIERDSKDCHIHLRHYDQTMIETKPNTKKDNSTKNNFNLICLSKPQENNSMDEFIEPLEICEAVISNGNVELENFVSELSVYSEENNLPRMEQTAESNIKTIQNSIPHFQIIESRNKNTHVENFHISTNITNSFGTEINISNKDQAKNLGNIINTENYINSVGTFNLVSRRGFMPKGMSPIFKNCFSKNICSYNLDVEYYDDVIYDKFFEDVVENTEVYEPHVQAAKEIVARPVQKVTDNIKKDNAYLVFGTESLVAAQVVLGQVDSKFIAAKIRGKSQTLETSEFLVLFDQHAVHERIRLENNLSYYFNGNTWKNVTIDAISFKLCKDEIIYLHNHKDKFIQFGLEWTVLNDSEIMVHSIPVAILGKNPRPMETVTKSVKTLISEQVHAIRYLKGNINLYSQSILNLLFSEACRYAIKFGDILSKSDCSQLIFALASCKTPFQCAHGRPVMAVMMELKCDRTEYKVSDDDHCLQIDRYSCADLKHFLNNDKGTQN